MIIDRKKIIYFVTIWWLVFLGLSAAGINNFQILNIIGFPALAILPGFLTLLAAKIDAGEFWGNLGLAIGISLFELMMLGLLGNTFLVFAGVKTPLAKSILLLILSDFIFVLLVFVWKNNRNLAIPIKKKFLLFENFQSLAAALVPAAFVLASVMGAIRLNDGSDGVITFLMLCAVAIYAVIAIRKSDVWENNVIPTAIFFISLALLFMTSLRSWYITGHDIQKEYQVFELAKNFNLWSVDNFREAYNACMSITVLPTVFSKLLDVPDPYIYKALFQIIFAIVPVVLYLTLKKYTARAFAFIAVFYFISFPTFFTDMPMLNRQEIAFVFLSLMFYVIFKESLQVRIRRLLFVVLGLGIVLSHYSTTYVVIAILVFLLCAYPIAAALEKKLYEKKKFLNSGVAFYFTKPVGSSLITVKMVAVLILASFFWSSIFTGTSSGSIFRVINETFSAIKSNMAADFRSGDTAYSLFSGRKADPTAELKEYNEAYVLPARQEAPEGTYYGYDAYMKYPLKAAEENITPLTPAGRILAFNGINVISLNYAFKQISAKMLQILIIIGLVFVVFNKKFLKKPLDGEFVLLAAGSIIIILLQVVLPVLSVEYGLLRAFQQGLFFLGIFVTIGSLTLVKRANKHARIMFASSLALIFFFSSVGIFTYLLGGYGQQLHLGNDGQYYDIYYVHTSEVAGINWIEEKVCGKCNCQVEVQSDHYPSLETKSGRCINFLNDITPGIIKRDAYVFLGFTNVAKKQSAIFYNGDIITYTYPITFLDSNKDLIYNNGKSRIYK